MRKSEKESNESESAKDRKTRMRVEDKTRSAHPHYKAATVELKNKNVRKRV